MRFRYNTSMSLSFRILLFALLVVEGVEANLGLGPGSNPVLGRETEAQVHVQVGTRSFGPPRGRGSGYVDHFEDYPEACGRESRSLRERPLSQPPLSMASISN